MNRPKYADYPDQADYADYTRYAEYAEYAEYTEYAKPVNAWVRSAFSDIFYLGKLSQSHQQAILMSTSPMKCTLDFYSMPASASGWGH